MHISDVHDYGLHEDQTAVTAPFIALNRREQIKKELEQLVDDEFEQLQKYANEYISNLAADRAETFLERVLKGDDDAAKSLLLGDQCGSSRYRTGGCEEGKPWASLINGRLFESGGIELRRKIVEAHADLLKAERIADLESVVDGLSQQIRKLEAQLHEETY